MFFKIWWRLLKTNSRVFKINRAWNSLSLFLTNQKALSHKARCIKHCIWMTILSTKPKPTLNLSKEEEKNENKNENEEGIKRRKKWSELKQTSEHCGWPRLQKILQKISYPSIFHSNQKLWLQNFVRKQNNIIFCFNIMREEN